MDETRFVLVPKLKKVIAKKGLRQVHKVAHGNSHEHISVAPTISAAGSYIPPLVIYKGVHTIPDLLQGAPPGAVMSFTDTRYMFLLMLDGHKSHISYMCIDFCYQNGIFLYALPSHTTHILQPSEIPFAKLKKEFGKQYDKYYNTTSKVVTKYNFTKLFGPAFIETYASSAICNAFKATEIWSFNPKAISPDHLNPSLATKRFNILMSEKEMLKNEIKSLKVQLTIIQEKLGTYKSPRISSLRLVFKYIPHVLQAGPSDTSSVNQQEPGPFPKKRKMLLFAQLLTNDESWQKLKETNKEAERKVEKKKRKKVLAAQKKIE
ncbi:7203_t:CDS:2 [Cetraspora pellucida]|uniref:7203_t:CDS:1 n=1 Tax=Cetraspora pellucida TaxID=1433469 RepID=A0A9N9PEB5_9GLOM|nr:7203_t:CDS:2 [Cetraspora pellucida]